MNKGQDRSTAVKDSLLPSRDEEKPVPAGDV